MELKVCDALTSDTSPSMDYRAGILECYRTSYWIQKGYGTELEFFGGYMDGWSGIVFETIEFAEDEGVNGLILFGDYGFERNIVEG